MCSHPTELCSAASKIHIHPTTCCRLPHSFVRKLCHRIVPAIKQRQRIASQNAPPSSNSCFHPPATPVPILHPCLVVLIGLFAPFSSSMPHLYCAEGDNPAFSTVTHLPLSTLVLLMLDGCLAHFWTGANMKRGQTVFPPEIILLTVRAPRGKDDLLTRVWFRG